MYVVSTKIRGPTTSFIDVIDFKMKTKNIEKNKNKINYYAEKTSLNQNVLNIHEKKSLLNELSIISELNKTIKLKHIYYWAYSNNSFLALIIEQCRNSYLITMKTIRKISIILIY